MPGLQPSRHLRRFRYFHLHALGFVVPTQSTDPKKFAAFSRVPTRLHDSHDNCRVSSSCVRLVLRLDSFPNHDAVMFLSASDQNQCFSPSCVHKETEQLFRTQFHLREICNQFLSRPSECALHHRFQIPVAATDSKMNDHSLCVATGEGWTSVHHAWIHLPCGCH